MIDKIIGFIGAGNMGSAMIGGIVHSELVTTSQIIASAHSAATLEKLQSTYSIETTLSNETVAERSDILFLAVKPNKFDEVIPQISSHVKSGCVIVSIAAGKTIAAIEDSFGKPVKLVRAMPNTPALVGEALSAGSADIGFISGGNYVLFSDDCDVLLTALRYAINKDSEDPKEWNDGTIEENTDKMSTYYRSIILAGPSEKGQELLAKVNNGEELTWDDLNSATWAVMGPTSASGYIYPSLWLNERYGKTIADLANAVQSDSYTTSLARLASGQADLMVSYGHIRTKYAPDWKEKFGGTDDMVKQTGIIGVTEGIYNDMIAYSKTSELMQDADFRQALGDSFIEIAGTDEGKDIIKVFSQVGYEWGDDANYDGERAAQEMLKSMN